MSKNEINKSIEQEFDNSYLCRGVFSFSGALAVKQSTFGSAKRMPIFPNYNTSNENENKRYSSLLKYDQDSDEYKTSRDLSNSTKLLQNSKSELTYRQRLQTLKSEEKVSDLAMLQMKMSIPNQTGIDRYYKSSKQENYTQFKKAYLLNKAIAEETGAQYNGSLDSFSGGSNNSSPIGSSSRTTKFRRVRAMRRAKPGKNKRLARSMERNNPINMHKEFAVKDINPIEKEQEINKHNQNDELIIDNDLPSDSEASENENPESTFEQNSQNQNINTNSRNETIQNQQETPANIISPKQQIPFTNRLDVIKEAGFIKTSQGNETSKSLAMLAKNDLIINSQVISNIRRRVQEKRDKKNHELKNRENNAENTQNEKLIEYQPESKNSITENSNKNTIEPENQSVLVIPKQIEDKPVKRYIRNQRMKSYDQNMINSQGRPIKMHKQNSYDNAYENIYKNENIPRQEFAEKLANAIKNSLLKNKENIKITRKLISIKPIKHKRIFSQSPMKNLALNKNNEEISYVKLKKRAHYRSKTTNINPKEFEESIKNKYDNSNNIGTIMEFPGIEGETKILLNKAHANLDNSNALNNNSTLLNNTLDNSHKKILLNPEPQKHFIRKNDPEDLINTCQDCWNTIGIITSILFLITTVAYFIFGLVSAFDMKGKEAYFGHDPTERTIQSAAFIKTQSRNAKMKTDDWGYFQRTYYNDDGRYTEYNAFLLICFTTSFAGFIWLISAFLEMYKFIYTKWIYAWWTLLLDFIGLVIFIIGNVFIFTKICIFYYF